MIDSKRVPIDSVEIDAARGILVRPRIASSESYEFVYRAATGVRWNRERRALMVHEVKDRSPSWWFARIVEAAKSEYGHRLELEASTLWNNVPDKERREIESVASRTA